MNLLGKLPSYLGSIVVLCGVVYMLFSERRSVRRNHSGLCGRCGVPLGNKSALIQVNHMSKATVCLKCAASVRRNYKVAAIFFGFIVLTILAFFIRSLIS